MSRAVNIIKNSVIWCVGLIILTIPLFLLFIWKNSVILCAKLLRPSLRGFQTSDIMTIGDSLYKKPMINIGLILKVKGTIDIQDLRTHFAKCLLDPKDSQNQPINMNLFSFIVRYGGYCFKQRVTQMNLENQIYETQINDRETFSEFVVKFFYSPYPEGEPLWNICVLPGFDILENNQKIRNDNKSTIFFRLHHSMGDGYSLIFLFVRLTPRSTPVLTNSFRESFCQKVNNCAINLIFFFTFSFEFRSIKSK